MMDPEPHTAEVPERQGARRIPHARYRAFQRVPGYCPTFVVKYTKAVILRRAPDAVWIGGVGDNRSVYRITLPEGQVTYALFHDLAELVVTFLTVGNQITLMSPYGRFLLHEGSIERVPFD